MIKEGEKHDIRRTHCMRGNRTKEYDHIYTRDLANDNTTNVNQNMFPVSCLFVSFSFPQHCKQMSQL